MLFSLANSLWPRSGANRRNSGQVLFSGPTRGVLTHTCALPEQQAFRGGGIAVAENGSIIVVSSGGISWFSSGGTLLSSAPFPAALPVPPGEELSNDDTTEEPPYEEEASVEPYFRPISPPVALSEHRVLLTATPELWLFDATGALVHQSFKSFSLDDSVLAPNCTHDGALLLTYMSGEVERIANGVGRYLGTFGYDVVSPAIYHDDSLLLSGYGGAGCVRVDPDGKKRWTASIKDPDLLPAIAMDEHAAVGSLNEKRSVLLSPEGHTTGTLPFSAVFAEGNAQHWIARSNQGVHCVTREGVVRWSVALDRAPQLRWGRQAPITDRDGNVYVLSSDALCAFSGDTGALLFRCALPSAPTSALAAVAEGRLAVCTENALLLF